jgi:hypothetical protein
METVYEPIQRLQLEMGKAGLDALVAMSPENIGYLAGYLIPFQIMPIRHRNSSMRTSGETSLSNRLGSNSKSFILSTGLLYSGLFWAELYAVRHAHFDPFA